MTETALRVAGSRQTGVSGARRLEFRPIPVTLAALPQSIIYTRSLRDATPLAGSIAPGLSPQTKRESEGGSLKEACKMLTTGLQHACNMLPTTAILRHYYGITLAPLGGHDRIPLAESPRFHQAKGGNGRVSILLTSATP
jgi:hypothetical protein